MDYYVRWSYFAFLLNGARIRKSKDNRIFYRIYTDMPYFESSFSSDKIPLNWRVFFKYIVNIKDDEI